MIRDSKVTSKSTTAHIMYCVRYLHPACMQRTIPMKFNELNRQVVETKGNGKSIELCLKQDRSTFITVALFVKYKLENRFKHSRQEHTVYACVWKI